MNCSTKLAYVSLEKLLNAPLLNGKHEKDMSFGSGTRIVRMVNLYRGDTVNVNSLDRVEYPHLPANDFFLDEGDLLVNRTSLKREGVGKAVLISDLPEPAYFDCSIIRIRPNKSKVYPRYLLYALNSPAVRPQIMKGAKTATITTISQPDISRLRIPLPPLPEQRRIAAILDKTNAIRRKRQEALRCLANLKTSIFCKMFGNVVRNSKDWPTARFGEVCDSRLGKMLDVKQQTGKYRRPYLRNANVKWDRLDLSEVFEMDFNEKDRKIFNLRYGDVLICEGGEVGRAALWHDQLPECYFQKALHRVRPDPAIVTSEYIVNLMWSYAHNGGFKNHVTSATIAHLTGVKLKEIAIPIPPLSLQKEFVSRVRKTMKLEFKQVKTSRRLDELFNSLVQRAFRGLLEGGLPN